MDELSFLKNQAPLGTVSAVRQVIALFKGWYRNFQPDGDTLTSWSFLLKDCDSSLFLPAAEVWGRDHREWPPSAPEFWKVVEQMDRERENNAVRQANARLVQVSKSKGLRYAGGDQEVDRGVHLFDRTRNTADREQIQFQKDLAGALKEDQFFLVYQPIVDMESGHVVAAEALARWTSPDQLGTIMPDEFIPTLEQTGLIVQVGGWAMQRACEQLAQWRREGTVENSFTMHVNVSRVQLLSDRILSEISSALENCQVSAESVCVEITETALVNFHDTEGTIQKISDLGVRVAIDDVGAGYSSMKMLTNLPIDILKIDRSLVEHIGEEVGGRAEIVIESIASLSKRLDMTVIAEGVETQDQAERLLEIGCRLGQGFLFAKPMTVEEFGKAVLRDIRQTDSKSVEYESYEPPF